MLNDLMAGHLWRGPLGRRQRVRFEPTAPYGVPGQPSGYDSSGINPGGMYTGGQAANFPANPGGFAPMGGQFPPQPMTGGPLQAQSSYPQGLAGLFRGFSPYRFG